MRSLRNDLSFVLFRTTIIRFNYGALSNNKHAFIMKKRTRTRILIKRIIIIMRNITTRKMKNTMSIMKSQRSKITTMSKSSFSRSLSYVLGTRNVNDATWNSFFETNYINIFAIARSNRRRKSLSKQKTRSLFR